jgi:hypothetical protein
MQDTALAQATSINAILSSFSPNRNVDWNGADLAPIQNAYDREYVARLIKTLRDLDPGNKHLRLGMNLTTPTWPFWLIYFRGKFTETHFKILRSVQHQVQGWIPIKDGAIWLKDNPEFGTCLWVVVTPLPQNTLMLGGPEEQMALPAPLNGPIFRLPAPEYEQRPSHPPPEKQRKTRDSSPKRNTVLSHVARLFVGPPKESSESES